MAALQVTPMRPVSYLRRLRPRKRPARPHYCGRVRTADYDRVFNDPRVREMIERARAQLDSRAREES